MPIHVCTCLSNRFYICFCTKSCKMMHYNHQYSMQPQYLVTQTKLHSMGLAARRPARSAGSQWTLSLGDARSKLTSMLPLSARLVAYQILQSSMFILVCAATSLPIVSSILRSSYFLARLLVCTFGGRRGQMTDRGQSSIAGHRPRPKGCFAPTNLVLPAGFAKHSMMDPDCL